MTTRKKGIRTEDLAQGTPEWLAWREFGIGGSDAGAIMGTSPWMDVKEAWQHKLHLIPDIQTNDAMQRGHDLEPFARLEFELEHHLRMPAACYIHSEYDFMRASLDGVSSNENVLLEIKCPGLTAHREALSGKIKPQYYTQMQHQMAVVGAELCYYWSYTDVPDIQPTKLIEVPRDEEYIQRLIERCSAFWDCVKNKVEPDPARFAVKDAGLLNGTVRTDPAFKMALDEILGARKVLEDAQAQWDIRASRMHDLLNRKKQQAVVANGFRLERIYLDGKWQIVISEQDEL